jgi:heptosyltransferase-2
MLAAPPSLFAGCTPGPLAVVQPLPGIGDMVWHLPHIRAVAEAAGRAVTLVAKPRSAADQIFAAEPAVRDVLWMDRNPDGRRGAHDGPWGLARFVGTLRARHFRAIVILHHSHTAAAAAWLARIPARYGYGTGAQRWFLNRPPFLRGNESRLHPFEQASAWLRAAGLAQAEAEPSLPVLDEARAIARSRIGGGRVVAIGVGSSEPYKQWGAPNFAALAKALLAAGWERLALVGGAAEADLVAQVVEQVGAEPARIVPVVGWKLTEVAALCAESALYVGNDTGVMNIAAAVGIPAFGLFGGWPPFTHSRRVVRILPPDGRPDRATGMARITPQAVMAAIDAHFANATRAIG